MKSQYEKAVLFKKLHDDKSTFIIPNPWDIASTKILSYFGFKALATSSAAYSFSQGVADNKLPIDNVLVHLEEIASATDLPVSADLGNGFYDTPEKIFETIKKAAKTGIVGASIEDVNSKLAYPLEFATERVSAAVEASRKLDFPFILTARADNYFIGNPDIKDTIKRLQAYQDAGADVLFAPGIKTLEDIQSILHEIDRPLNVLMGIKESNLNFDDLSNIGVKRISLGASLYRNAMTTFIETVKHINQYGEFDYADKSINANEIYNLFISNSNNS
ncbi:isocitrate lyase/phosphoenolpyruvate mutase family protein [Flavobacterium sufflavum]|uniref:Isocitrate lyase/phosphoenolpyruvate mutase family protein n=1 Tax=Flavobacterium sufflavum TaxID=1921138 RepID=A0A3S2UNA7_9FLAO|nr:isocitrate lyase/phosphoenolpyruvate mutase family protein [Flavobacterium sufflavum]RVT75389.1 isocitrate lyase/phosphoenolpyruvate mutase family protein [Flavobacterium sufflavum]